MENKLNIIDQLFGLISKISEWLDKFGVLKLIRTAFTIFLLYWMCVIAFNPSVIFEKYQEWYDKLHDDKIEKTLEAQLQIHHNLIDLRYKSNAMRCHLYSMHNGSANINGQYQFLKVSCLFEECGDNPSVMDEYQNIHLTQFNIFSYLYQTHYFCGSVEDLKEVDTKLYYRLIANGVNYLHIQALIGGDGKTIGLLVLTWDEEPKDHLSLHNEIYKYASVISRLME